MPLFVEIYLKFRGKYIAHLDCDDYYHKDKISKSIDYINKNIFYLYKRKFNNAVKILYNNNNIQSIERGNISKIITNETTTTNSIFVAKRECFNKIDYLMKNFFG